MPSTVTKPSVPIIPAAVVLIVAQLVIRSWLAATGGFYWDDLILIGRASSLPIGSWDYLGHSHDGHFMPAAFLVAGLSTMAAPVNWVIPAITLVILQGLASVAVWRMIRIVVGGRRDGVGQAAGGVTGTRDVACLGALAFYLFTPMTVPAFTWWAAGLNSLPMQAAMAWIVADAVILTRAGADGQRVDDVRRRLVVIRSVVVFVIALAFFEKSLFILPVALIAAVLVRRTENRSAPALGAVVVAGRALWAPMTLVFVLWALLYFSVADATAGTHSLSQTAQLVWRSINRGVVPALVGGPWDWERWIPSPPMGFASIPMIVAGWLVVAGGAFWAVRRRAGAAAILVAAAVYVVGAQIPVMWNRSSANTALELAQTLRYLPDSAVVLTLACALLIAAPALGSAPARRARHAAETASTIRLAAGFVGAALIFASAVISTASYQSSWTDGPTAAYLANAKRALAANRDHPMFDQALPLEVLLPVAYPNNQISHVFGRLADRPEFGSVTDRLFVLDNAGNLTPGAVTARRAIAAGRGTCARPEADGSRRLRVDGPLIRWRWTIALTYCAGSAGIVEMALDDGPAVRVPVQAGLHVVYVQLDGHGSAVSLRPITTGLVLHTGEGRVGEVVAANLLGR
ncbi:MAG: hypothetical protein QM662_05740 [Gordonia sp. (in: high G+C Gram-positive bacteria)]